MAQLRQKLNRTKCLLATLRHQVSNSLLKTIYFALFDSNLRYAAQVWGQGGNNVVDVIKRTQNKALQIISLKENRTIRSSLCQPQNFEITKYHYIEIACSSMINFVITYQIFSHIISNFLSTQAQNKGFQSRHLKCQTLLRLKQLNTGIKKPKKFSFTLISFSNEVNTLDLSKHLSKYWKTYPILTSSVKH